jgi:hypothetical protein
VIYIAQIKLERKTQMLRDEHALRFRLYCRIDCLFLFFFSFFCESTEEMSAGADLINLKTCRGAFDKFSHTTRKFIKLVSPQTWLSLKRLCNPPILSNKPLGLQQLHTSKKKPTTAPQSPLE